ncbi:MAG: NAD(P)/FAD-dependent oxidoreductase [Candidatus Dormibacteraeota bacterium]|nr:NAD(P)/FAD-dependent oxidoreductase [Candidatus Dormibacteraeota bacterium]
MTATLSTPPSRSTAAEHRSERVSVVIVGTGFAGLGMAIRLKQSGVQDFVVLEKAGSVGGTWRDNTYPGCMCDVPSSLYSFSFAQKADWSTTYPRQAEIWDYLRDCAQRFGVLPHIRFHQEMRSASWDAASARWRVSAGAAAFETQYLVLGAGALSEPRVPDLPGLDGFGGPVFHSARWRHDLDLRGKRVAVVGTGASAVQFVPEIQPQVAQLQLYQRTPAWILPHPNRRLSQLEQTAGGALPALRDLRRAGVYAGRELLVLGLTVEPRMMALGEAAARRHLRRQVADPELRRALTPSYRLGCKRMLLSNDFYPALTRDNVELVPHAITAVSHDAVVAADGSQRRADVLIFGTGFQVTEFPVAQRIDNGAQVLGEVWRGSPQAYMGTTVADFPNLFVLTGPNTGLGHTSVVHVIESQVRHVLECLRAARRNGAEVIEVRPEAQDTYNERLQQRMRRTVWTTGGCRSWYLDARGRNSTLWPSFTFVLRHRLRRFDESAYALTSPARAAAPSG